MRFNQKRVVSSIILVVLVLFLFSFARAAEEEKERRDARPERGIGVFTEYAGVTVPRGETVRMDLILDDKGRTDETIDVRLVSVPRGWKANVKGGNYGVSGMFVPAGKTKNLALTLEPEKTIAPGNYVFQFEAKTRDGALKATHDLVVTVVQRTAMGGDDLQISTSYPVLRGQTDATFEFSVDVLNKAEADRTFNLSAVAPEKWEISFKPAYEQKQISSLRVKGGQSQAVAVGITPAKESPPGEYPVLVRVNTGDKKAEAKLMVVLTGIYKLDAGTPSGNLSLEAVPGKTSNFSVFVKNSGSAPNKNISFSSFKPENWAVEFKPDKIESLEPGALKQVEVSVKPNVQALVGDYSVGVLVNGEKADKSVEMRVTVKASSAWGWIGIGLILIVIAGLAGLFVWLGRR